MRLMVHTEGWLGYGVRFSSKCWLRARRETIGCFAAPAAVPFVQALLY